MATNFEDARALLNAEGKNLRRKANVVATGIGYKFTNGKMSDQLSIICSVEKKSTAGSIGSSDLVPKSLDGIPTDVFVTGHIAAFDDPTQRFRPAPGGVSLGHYLITAGTLGCVVKRDGKRYILSNNHVLANSNDAQIGDDILQPGPYDGGSRPEDVIAHLADFVPIVFDNGGGGGSDCPIAGSVAGFLNGIAAMFGRKTRLKAVYTPQASENIVDCAIAEPINDADISNEILNIGALSGIAEGTLGMSLKKSGRTTGLTTGNVLQVDVTSSVSYGSGKVATFVDQLMAGNMSAGGDSGSAVLNDDNKIVGLLFAGGSNTTIINRIQNVFSQLNLTLP